MRYESIQFLRAAAALMVVFHHFLLANLEYGSPNSGAHFYNIAGFGAAGVDLFFCISGFVMMAAIQKEIKKFSPASFLLRRCIRILPLYFLSTLGFVLLVGLATWKKGGSDALLTSPLFSLEYLLQSFLLLPIFNPLNGEFQPFLAQGWTLSYEFLFYLLLAAAASFAGTKGVKPTALLVFFLILILFAASGLFSSAWNYFLGNSVVFEFLLGIAAYFLVERGINHSGTWLLIGCISLGSTIFFSDFNRIFLWGLPSFLILTGIARSHHDNIIWKSFHHIGDASFSIYLTHGYFTYIYGGLLKRGIFSSAMTQDAMVFIGTLTSTAFGIFVFSRIEKPLTSFLKNRRYLLGQKI